jgi:hypothetical protein
MTLDEPFSEVLEPRAEDLVESLRAFGYDTATALADLVDNSITAGATTVSIDYSSDPGSSWVAVVDDGRGMDFEGLRNAMRFAGQPLDGRTAVDLGRFGLGLKTASLSQARRLTVYSHQPGSAPVCMTWDLDFVREQRKWVVIRGVDDEALAIIREIGFDKFGTVVLWRDTDKLGSGRALRRRMAEAGRELSLLFHRFIAAGRLSLRVGQTDLVAMDPYLARNPLTQNLGVEFLEHAGVRVTVNPFVLPHPSRLSQLESAIASGPGGMLGRQGFYVYRGDRLVVAGGWLGLPGMHNSTPTRLARVILELPSTADLDWSLDVRKSTVIPPGPVESRVTEIAAEVRARSERVFTYRGSPAPSTTGVQSYQPVWRQVRRLGRLEYSINREHPLIRQANGDNSGGMLEGVLRMVETTLPAGHMADGSGTNGGQRARDDETSGAEEILAAFRSMLTQLPADPGERLSLAEALAGAEPFNRFPGLVREVIESDQAKES